MNTVILDFDGTIADTKSLIVSTMQQTLSVLGLPARSDEACASMIGLPLRQTFTDLIPMDDETADLCDKTYRELFMQNNKPGIVKLFPHVRETIAELYAMGIIITVASSRGRDTLVSEQAKPAPDMVYVIMEHSEAEKEDVLMVGDTVFDIDMGKNAGVKTCGVTYGNGKIDELSHADYIINDFAQLLDIV